MKPKSALISGILRRSSFNPVKARKSKFTATAFCSLLFFLLAGPASAQPFSLSLPVNLFQTNTTITSFGLNRATLVLLGGTNAADIHVPLATSSAGRTASTFMTFSSLAFGSAGYFKAVVSNDWTPPPILGAANGLRVISLPEDQIALTNTDAMFVVQAEPIVTNDVVTYQWHKNEVVIPGETNFFLFLTNVQTNIDVGFYTCDIQAGTNPVYRSRNKDGEAPGARLYVYSGTNTPVTGPYQPAPAGAIAGSTTCGTWDYVGWVLCKNPEVTSKFYGTSYFDKPTFANSLTATDFTVAARASSGYLSRFYGIETSTRPPFCPAVNTALTVNPANPPVRYLYQFTIYVLSTGSGGLSLGAPITYEIKWTSL